ncbi:hypothetical protein WK28_15970 [Burkholderia vietnamiensis]|nr:hypothetical protein WK28_15970 [Burkholderia vietnamiensis]
MALRARPAILTARDVAALIRALRQTASQLSKFVSACLISGEPPFVLILYMHTVFEAESNEGEGDGRSENNEAAV